MIQRQETSDCLLTLSVRRVSVVDDAVNLIVHHVKRQSSIHSDEKRKIKKLLRQMLPSLFSMSPRELSDDDDDDDDDDDEGMAVMTS